MSTPKRPSRAKVEEALRILNQVLEDDDIAFRLGKDLAEILLLPSSDGRQHGARFTVLAGFKTERGIAREVCGLTGGVLKEVYRG